MVRAAIFDSAGKKSSHYLPGVYTRTNNVNNPTGISASNLCIIGQSTGGKPKTLMAFNSLDEAKATLVAGDLLNAIAYAFNASKDGYVPSTIYAMRSNAANQGTADLDGKVTVKSWDYGVHVNSMKITVGNGSSAGKKIKVEYQDESYERDNLAKPSLTIKGVGSAKTFSITAEKITVGSKNYLFETYPTLSEIAGAINADNDVVVTIEDNRISAKSNELDLVTSGSATTSGVTVYSNIQCQVEFLRSIPLVGEVTITTRSEITNKTYSISGGTKSVATSTDYTNCLKELETEDVQIIATPEDSIDIANLIVAHCISMSSITNKKERTCLLGAAKNISDDNGKENAKDLNSELCSYVIDSCIAKNPFTGETETISGAMVAVMLASMESSMDVNMPLTFKRLNVLGVSKKRSLPNMEDLIKAGIMVVNPNPENMVNVVCIRAMTTFQDDDLICNERSMTREALYMARDIRSRLAGGVGDVGNGSTSSAIQTLKDAADIWKEKGYIIPDGSKNVWDISAIVDGDQIKLEYSVYLAAPLNFLFVTTNNHVYSTSVNV